ncbi:MAG TPA: LytR C-terminal domain-containing protein, partial [Candidatus Woesebacteria bacterium]|nr:LytR C-terminal domain-containing protein [Candidatus Woesebacteria bacterium]
LLPELGINEEDYYLDTTVLSNYKGSFKVQLTALEKSVVAPLAKILKEHKDIKIETISPLSWTSKSIISLEPSVAILQMGNHLFLAEHYIGVDQCYSVPVAEAENFTETVKTLKGVEPSLQTVYLLTNSLVDDAIKEKLKQTLPVQQLADLASENGKMPSYIKQIIEASAKTFSIPEFLLPQFVLDKNCLSKETLSNEKEEENVSNLVKPAVVGAAVLPTPVNVKATDQVEVLVESLEEIEIVKEEPQIDSKETDSKETDSKETDSKETEKEPSEELEKQESKMESAAKTEPESMLVEPKVPEEEKEIDFSQLANLAIDPTVFNKNRESLHSDKSAKDGKGEMKMTDLPEKKIIKNQDDGSSVTKMILIGFLSFAVTIALGVGIGLAYLQWTNRNEDSTPVVEVEPDASTVVEVTATPTPLVEINKDDYKILVVNATTKAGYATTIAAKVRDADFANVTAKNAKETYDKGDYLLVKEDNANSRALLKELEQATSLTLTLQTDIEKEDSSAASTSAVLVLGQ